MLEHDAGRLGGQDNVGVVWSDEAIDRLLDRSDLAAQSAEQDAAAAAAAANDILAGFKVAHFELQEQPQAGEDGLAAAEAAAAESLQPAAHTRDFWEGLLSGRWAEMQSQVPAAGAEAEELGKGKRRRRQLAGAQQGGQLDALLRAAERLEGGSGSEGGSSDASSSESRSGEAWGGMGFGHTVMMCLAPHRN